MFYPVPLDLSDRSRLQRAEVVLNPSESKRLLGKAVAALPEVRNAYANGRLSISVSSTSAFVLDELTGERLPAYTYCCGMVAHGVLTLSGRRGHGAHSVLRKGQARGPRRRLRFLDTFEKGDAVVKGANAVDPVGNAGVTGGEQQGGNIGAILSLLAVRGLPIILPVGLEKSIASVIDASSGWGKVDLSLSTGLPTWLFPVTCGLVVTEIQALGILAGVGVRHIASGGIGGSEGAVILLLEGYEESIAKAWDIVQGVKGEPPLSVHGTSSRDHSRPTALSATIQGSVDVLLGVGAGDQPSAAKED